MAPVLVAVKAGKFPVKGPAPKPIAVFVLVHMIVAPDGLLDKINDPTLVPAQNAVSTGIIGIDG